MIDFLNRRRPIDNRTSALPPPPYGPPPPAPTSRPRTDEVEVGDDPEPRNDGVNNIFRRNYHDEL